jgi:hypothetical protein
MACGIPENGKDGLHLLERKQATIFSVLVEMTRMRIGKELKITILATELNNI